MKFVLSKTIGEEREIIDFLPTMVGWGRWENPEQKIECEYELEKGDKIINDKGEVKVIITKSVEVSYKDGNNNLHHLQIENGTTWNVNPILFVDDETENETAE